MGYEPVTNCKVCGDAFDVYHAPDDRVCDNCKEIEMELSDEERAHILERRAQAEAVTEKAINIPMDACGLTVNVGRDGAWLNFSSPGGPSVSLNVGNMANEKTGIIGRGLAAWCMDRQHQAETLKA